MTPEVFSGFIGTVLPPFVDIVNEKLGAEKGRWKFFISLLISIMVGTAMTVIEAGSFSDLYENGDTLLLSIGAAFTASQAVYQTYWKPSGNSARLKAVVSGEDKK